MEQLAEKGYDGSVRSTCLVKRSLRFSIVKEKDGLYKTGTIR